MATLKATSKADKKRQEWHLPLQNVSLAHFILTVQWDVVWCFLFKLTNVFILFTYLFMYVLTGPKNSAILLAILDMVCFSGTEKQAILLPLSEDNMVDSHLATNAMS